MTSASPVLRSTTAQLPGDIPGGSSAGGASVEDAVAKAAGAAEAWSATRAAERGRMLADAPVTAPVCSVPRANDVDDAVAVADATWHGLGASVIRRDLDAAMGVVGRLDVVMVRVNVTTTGTDFWAPFGGAREARAGPRKRGRACGGPSPRPSP